MPGPQHRQTVLAGTVMSRNPRRRDNKRHTPGPASLSRATASVLCPSNLELPPTPPFCNSPLPCRLFYSQPRPADQHPTPNKVGGASAGAQAPGGGGPDPEGPGIFRERSERDEPGSRGGEDISAGGDDGHGDGGPADGRDFRGQHPDGEENERARNRGREKERERERERQRGRFCGALLVPPFSIFLVLAFC